MNQHTRQDPRHQYPGTEHQERREQEHPGTDRDMTPRPDHGEHTYEGSGRLTDAVAVVTGADSGIGRAVTIAYAREGADVVLSYLPEEQADAEQSAEHVRAAGRRAVLVPGDLRTEEACRELVTRAVEEFGRIDVLVDNAGYQMSQPEGLLGITTEQFDRVFKTNLYSMFWLCKAAVPHMPPGGCVIATTSIQAYQPSPHLMDYAATKAGIVNLTKSLAEDLADKGLRVNAVAPGPIWTPLIPATMPPEALESFGGDTPLGRAGQPAEVAPAYVFFASQESSYITGEVLGVTGGRPLS